MKIGMKDLEAMDIYLEGIEETAEEMAKSIARNRGRRPKIEKPEEERLREVEGFVGIKVSVLAIKKMLGLISKKEFRKELKTARGF